MKESDSNIGYTCAEHSRKPDPKFKKMPIQFFLGKYVKKAFPGITPGGKTSLEHMWVRVMMANKSTLIGVLDNHPIYDMDIKRGSTVKVRRNEIEQVYDHSTGQML